jgi:hypothetical protein
VSRQQRSSKAPAPLPQLDFPIENYGSVFFVRCESESAKRALLQFAEPHAHWFGDALAVEPRFIGGLVSSLREDGWWVG